MKVKMTDDAWVYPAYYTSAWLLGDDDDDDEWLPLGDYESAVGPGPSGDPSQVMEAPDLDTERKVLMWYLWGGLSAFCAAFILFVFLALASSLWSQYRPCHHHHTNSTSRRKSPFNLYLCFMMIPDLTMSLLCAVTCITNASKGHWTSRGSCYFQSWYVVFGFSGSAWMNALIAAEVYRMLKFPFTLTRIHQERQRQEQRRQEEDDRAASSEGPRISLFGTGSFALSVTSPALPTRYQPPRLGKIALQSTLVLLCTAFVSTWGLYKGIPWFPLDTGVNPSGISCFPTATASSQKVGQVYANLFFYGFFLWILLGVPLIFVGVLCFKIWKYNLLPSEGRSRVLAIFFFRLGTIFLVMWLPSLLLIFILAPHVNPWIEWSGGVWAHLQGVTSASFILTKLDVYQSIKRTMWDWLLWCCCPPRYRTRSWWEERRRGQVMHTTGTAAHRMHEEDCTTCKTTSSRPRNQSSEIYHHHHRTHRSSSRHPARPPTVFSGLPSSVAAALFRSLSVAGSGGGCGNNGESNAHDSGDWGSEEEEDFGDFSDDEHEDDYETTVGSTLTIDEEAKPTASEDAVC